MTNLFTAERVSPGYEVQRTDTADGLSAAKTMMAEFLGNPDSVALDDWEPRKGCIYTETRSISARVNQNFDGFPSEELKKAYHTFLGKPVFVNHRNEDPSRARGRVVASRYVENGDDKFISVIQEVDAERFPKLAHELETGGLDAVSMGCAAEKISCSYCGHVATDPFSSCDHIIAFKGSYLTRTAENGMPEDVLVFEECRDVSFFELSYVFDPADETALVSNVIMANTRVSFGEQEAPERVDTMREDDGADDDDWHQYVEPPSEFQDPDLDANKETVWEDEDVFDPEEVDPEKEVDPDDPAVVDTDVTPAGGDEEPDPKKKSSWRITDGLLGRTAVYRGSIGAEVSDDFGSYCVRVSCKSGNFFDSFGSFDEAMTAAQQAIRDELETK